MKDFWPVALLLLILGSVVMSFRYPPTPKCVSYLFYQHGDSTVYETHCVGVARPDSVANPPKR